MGKLQQAAEGMQGKTEQLHLLVGDQIISDLLHQEEEHVCCSPEPVSPLETNRRSLSS